MIKYAHESFSGDAHFGIPTFDFYFKFSIPKPNRERIITKRNSMGQIVHSRVLKQYPVC